jgi:hypothetical protein
MPVYILLRLSWISSIDACAKSPIASAGAGQKWAPCKAKRKIKTLPVPKGHALVLTHLPQLELSLSQLFVDFFSHGGDMLLQFSSRFKLGDGEAIGRRLGGLVFWVVSQTFPSGPFLGNRSRGKCKKCLILLARPNGFEPLTPRFVVLSRGIFNPLRYRPFIPVL